MSWQMSKSLRENMGEIRWLLWWTKEFFKFKCELPDVHWRHIFRGSGGGARD